MTIVILKRPGLLHAEKQKQGTYSYYSVRRYGTKKYLSHWVGGCTLVCERGCHCFVAYETQGGWILEDTTCNSVESGVIE